MNNDKYNMSWYFDRALEKGALLLDGSNLNWFEYPLFDCIKDEINNILNQPRKDIDWGYTYPGGINKFRKLIALHETYIEDEQINKEDVLITGNGVTGVISFICRYLSQKSENDTRNELIYPVPSYSGLLTGFSGYSIKPHIVQTSRNNNYCLTLNDVKDNYNEKTLALLITNPNNPACCYFDENELKAIFDFAIQHDFYIILDAIFEESPNISPKFIQSFKNTECYDKLIKIKGFSKDIPQLSDFRLGWSISKNKDFNDKMLEYGEFTNYSNSSFIEELGSTVMQHRVWLDQGVMNDSMKKYILNLKNYHNKIISSRNKVLDFIQNSDVFDDVIIPDAGNIIFASVNQEICHKQRINNSHEMFLFILEKTNILVTPGHVFGMNDDAFWFRITISNNIEVIMNGIRKIESIFKY